LTGCLITKSIIITSNLSIKLYQIPQGIFLNKRKIKAALTQPQS